MIKTYRSLSLKELSVLAQTLAGAASRGIVVGLTGDLGSGKTSFVKQFGKALKIKRVTSPSFTIINQARGKNFNFYHIDLYRLDHYRQLEALGFTELLNEQGAVTLIEWADKFPQLKKVCDIMLNFKFADQPNKRHVTIKF